MNLSGIGSSSGDKNLSAPKATLNPNAAEFVPFFLRSPVANITASNASPRFAPSTAVSPGKAVLDRSESSISNNSDEEAQRYWHNQLPDDITPDFNVMGIDDTHEINNIPFSSLSLSGIDEGSRYTASTGSGFMLKEHQGLSPRPVSSYGDYPSHRDVQPSLGNPWDKQIVGNDQLVAREGPNVMHGFLAEMSNEQLLMDNLEVGPLEFLASQFPGFAAESLAEVYFANGGDLNLTIEMITQLELQVDEGLNQTHSPLDFPALSVGDGQNGFPGDDPHQNMSPYQSMGKESTLLLRCSSIPYFASAVRKMASQDSSMWKYDRNGSSETSTGPREGRLW